MSLEESIKELAQSVRDLAAALNKPATASVLQISDEPGKGSVKIVPLETAEITAAEPPAPKPKKAKAPKVEEAPAPAPEPEPAPKPTLQDLRDAAQAALDAGKLSEVIALNSSLGLKRISEVTEDKYAEVIAKLKEMAANG